MAAVVINYLAVVVAGILSLVVGMLWYSPFLFGKKWMALSGKSEKDMAKMKGGEMVKMHVYPLLAGLVMAYVLAHFVDYTDATTIVGGMQTGFWLWLGFIVTTHSMNVVFGGKPIQLYLIDMGHYLIGLLVMGALLATWV